MEGDWATDCAIAAILRGLADRLGDFAGDIRKQADRIESGSENVAPIPVNLPFERVPQHPWDPGIGPVPPRPNPEPLHPSNIAAKPKP